MILATKVPQTPEIGLATGAWPRRLRCFLRKVFEKGLPRDGVAATDAGPPSPVTLTEEYRLMLNGLGETIDNDLIDRGYGALLAYDCETENEDVQVDPVAEIIREALTGLAGDPAFRLGDRTYLVCCSGDHEPLGVVVTKVAIDGDP